MNKTELPLEAFGDTLALQTDHKSLSYRQLQTQIQALADNFDKAIHPQVNVGILCHSKLNLLEALLALWKRSANVLILDTKLPENVLDTYIKTFEIQYLLSDTCLSNSNLTELQTLKDIRVYQTTSANKTNWLQRQNGAVQAHLIMLTSGTTGTPKGVVLGAPRVLSNAIKVACYTRIKAQKDKTFITLPLNYCYGLSQTLAHLWMGASVYLQDGFLQPVEVLQKIQAQGITNYAVTPIFYKALVSQPDLYRPFLQERALKNFKFFMNAGGSLPFHAIAACLTMLPRHISFFNNYGQTEAAPRLSFFEYEQTYQQTDHGIGKPIEGTSFKLENTHEGVGSLFYQTEDFMYGYYGINYDATPRWFDSSDVGYLDTDGYMHVLGRADGMLKINGRKVYLAALEHTIVTQFPFVNHIKMVYDSHQNDEYLHVKILSLQGTDKQFIEVKHFLKDLLPAIPFRLNVSRTPHYSSNGKYIL